MIEIQSLTFRYEGADRDALRDVSLTVPDGAFLGIINAAGIYYLEKAILKKNNEQKLDSKDDN